ncbi:MAG: adenylyltransferase/cytidyltransferase family protein [Alphaproteobacteria bacterium]|nr:adenylyltransferase/cytidyltransferase family protein [Alphaproteobacteria bacterium]
MSKKDTIVFVSGNFFALHPGHVRLLRFAAECGERLVVGVSALQPSNDIPTPAERAEALRELGIVTDVVILDDGVEAHLKALRPHIVVKGKEFEGQANLEEPILASYGGKLLFSSGESTYSGAELLKFDQRAAHGAGLSVPRDFLRRHSLTSAGLEERISALSRLSVVVVGDLIIDEYLHCEALGMSREDPTLVVTPRGVDRFVGGAGIVAAHAAALGAGVKFVSVVGDDGVGEDAARRLSDLRVQTGLIRDESRPTTLKQRFRAQDKTLLRVSHLRQHEISRALQDKMIEMLDAAMTSANLLIFSDFNYGCLPQRVVDHVTATARTQGILLAADSQSSSQVGDISRFKHARLLTATEYEARLALRDQNSGLAALGFKLLGVTSGTSAFVKLGAAGVLIVSAPHAKMLGVEDRLPALNSNPRDVSGAGDSMLTASAMALAAGASTWEAAYLGAVAAGIQTGRVGNIPITPVELRDAVRQ